MSFSSSGLLIKIMFTRSSIYLKFLCLYSSSASFGGTDRRYYRLEAESLVMMAVMLMLMILTMMMTLNDCHDDDLVWFLPALVLGRGLIHGTSNTRTAASGFRRFHMFAWKIHTLFHGN